MGFGLELGWWNISYSVGTGTFFIQLATYWEITTETYGSDDIFPRGGLGSDLDHSARWIIPAWEIWRWERNYWYHISCIWSVLVIFRDWIVQILIVRHCHISQSSCLISIYSTLNLFRNSLVLVIIKFASGKCMFNDDNWLSFFYFCMAD